jgi:Domain of unknown function (DUF4477)
MTKIYLIFCCRVVYCAKSAGVYACQRLVLGHHWPVASHQLAVLSRIWLSATRIVRLVGQLQPHLVAISSLLPPATIGSQILSPSQIEFLEKSCAASSHSKLLLNLALIRYLISLQQSFTQDVC